MSNQQQSSSPTTGATLRATINRVIAEKERRKAERDTCGGCGKSSALASITFRGQTLGQLCRFCPWTTFAVVAGPKAPKEKLARKRKG